jgi:hypothetical protein
MERPINERFDIDQLQELGVRGWEIVAVVPRTVGIGLRNVLLGSADGENWGGGIGGNVMGVYVLLKLEITANDNRLSDDEMARLIVGAD